MVEFSGVFPKISFAVCHHCIGFGDQCSIGTDIKRQQYCKFPTDCRLKGLVYGKVLQSVQADLQSAVYVFLDLLQPDSEIQYHQVTITSNVSAWKGPCLVCADPRSETVLYHDVIDLVMCSVGRMPSPPPRCLVLTKGVCQHHIVVAGELQQA